MNNFKFFNTKNEEEVMNTFFTFNPIQFANAEFCFQFDDEEPQVFATGRNYCEIRLSPTNNANMTFNHGNRRFRLFAREVVNENQA